MEFQLIDFIKANPIVYDKKYRSPHYREQKIAKWNEIARKLRRDPNTLRLKWKSLRDTFKKRLHRKKLDEEDALTSRNWKYHNALMFLKDQYTEVIVDYKSEKDEESDQDIDVEQVEQTYTNAEEEFEVENFDLNDYLKKFDSSTQQNPTAATSQNTNEEIPKKKKFDKESMINEACQEMTALLQNAKHHFTPPSATQTFFNSVAIQVIEAKLNPVDLMRLQQRVLEVVTQEILTYQQNRTFET
ncbi:uncharacterized protein [Musca autumnalis]|uniref:uncharacterized protein n=1 Tax=Musca autumnalis TaxID=221902 RepID=UPI003CEB298C